MKERFPDVEFRAIGVDLSGASGDYLQVSRMQQGARIETKLSPNGIERNYPRSRRLWSVTPLHFHIMSVWGLPMLFLSPFSAV
jgi:hypothetical protein